MRAASTQTNAVIAAVGSAAASAKLSEEPTPWAGERLWRHAYLAVLQGGIEMDEVDAELNRARARFPLEPRWVIIRAWHTEIRADDRPTGFRPPPLEGSAAVSASVVRAYESALRLPPVQAEAHTRLAYWHLAAGRTTLALEHADQGLQLTTETDIRLLGYLFRGWALTRSGRDAEALAAYRRAHEVMPTSQSAAIWLARSLFLNGLRTEAELAIDDTLRTGAGLHDPWRLFPRGDIRLWPGLIAQLREALR